MKKDNFETFISILFVLGLILSMILIMFLNPLDLIVEREERSYCYKLQEQAEKYKNFLYSHNNQSGFYVTEDDIKMCIDYEIIIKAPVK